jgi:AcrR family transcriptional regulator
MIASVQRLGYARTSVADVLALAGVSRRAFYEQFRDKEHCMLATHGAIVTEAARDAIAGWQTECGFFDGLHSGCVRLIENGRRQPDRVRFVLIDSVGIPGARARNFGANRVFERPLHAALRAQRGCRLVSSATAVVGATRHVMAKQMLEESVLSSALPRELVEWLDCYRVLNPSALSHRVAVPRASASLHIDGTPDALVDTAFVRLTLERGYANTSDAEIARVAGMSTKAFHKLYDDKCACLLGLRRRVIDLAMVAARCELASSEDWAEGICLGLAAILGVLAADEQRARVALVEFLEAGDRAVAEMCRPEQELAALIASGAPRRRAVPPLAAQFIAGAFWAIAAAYSASGRLWRLRDSAQTLAFTALSPYLGSTAALSTLADVARHSRLTSTRA